MTPTEALARALQEALGKDEWYALLPSDAAVAANRLRRRLRAKGYEVRPICQVCTDLHELHSGPKRTLTIEQAAVRR